MGSVRPQRGSPSGYRAGPFWIEEGAGLVVAGAVLLALVASLYLLAILTNPF
jgi:hypothetical protein